MVLVYLVCLFDFVKGVRLPNVGPVKDREKFRCRVAALDEAVEEVLCLFPYILFMGAEVVEAEDVSKDEAVDYARWVG